MLLRLFLRWSIVASGFAVLLVLSAAQIGRFIPTGTQITYVTKIDGRTWDLTLMDIDRRLAYNLTAPHFPAEVRNRMPVWSPDGSRLAFVSGMTERMGIVIFDLTSGRLRFLNDESADEITPDWSPNGAPRLVYAAFTEQGWDIFLQRVDGGAVTLIAHADDALVSTPENDRAPLWSPDGSQIAFVSGRRSTNDLFTVRSDGTLLRQLTQDMRVEENTLSWSPSSRHIVFVSNRDGNREIYSVNVETGAVLNLSRHQATDYAPMWSPDGGHIAFVSDRDGDDELYVMALDGSDVRQLTENNRYDYAPTWSPDGQSLLYISTPAFTSEIFRVHVETGKIQRLTYNTYDDWSPVWRP